MNSSLLVIAPLIPFVTALLMLFVRARIVLALMDVAASATLLGVSLLIARQVGGDGPVIALGVLRADSLSVVFLLLVAGLAVATSIASVGWIRREIDRGMLRREHLHYYHALVHAFIMTMVVTVLADNLGILWIAMEGTTISSAVLVGFHGHKDGLEAAWKYIIVTTIGISFGLFGTVLIYGAAAHARGGMADGVMNWSSIVAVADRLDPGIVRIGFIFVLVGYGTKAGLAPVHMWLPDAHSQAPTPVSALLSGALIKCALLGIIRFHTIARHACGPELSGGLLLLFGLVSVVVAAPFILVQHDLKRLLGYSSVEHVGIIALGLGFGGPVGTYGALLHVVTHGVTKALAFLVAGDAISRYGSRDMRVIKGFVRVAPWAGALLLCAVFSIAGTPPFAIFISELMVLRAGIGAGRYVVVGVFLVAVVVIFAGFVNHVGHMAFGTAGDGADESPESRTGLLGMLLVAAVMLLLGVHIPSVVNGVLVRATEVILG